jgi:hypothetical protein
MLRSSPFRKKALQMREAAGVAAMPNVVKQTAAYPVALRPSASQEVLEVERGTRLQGKRLGATTVLALARAAASDPIDSWWIFMVAD